MHRITWEQYHKDIDDLVKKIRSRRKKYSSLVAISRGGLILGTVLAHELDLPLNLIIAESYDKNRKQKDIKLSNIIMSPKFYESRYFLNKMYNSSVKMKWLLADDLVDNGSTVQAIKEKYSFIDFDTAVLYHKGKCTLPEYWIKMMNTWLEFPYEKVS